MQDSPLSTCQMPNVNPTLNSYVNYGAVANLQNVLGSNLTICSILNNFAKCLRQLLKNPNQQWVGITDLKCI